MAKGGRRPGAGRKPGSLNKLSAENLLKARQSGELPHEFLLRVSRGEEIDGVTPSFEQRMSAAHAAAPYFAPKLASIEQKIEGEVSHTILDRPLTPDEWDKQYGGDELTQ